MKMKVNTALQQLYSSLYVSMALLKLRILHLVCVITVFDQSDAPQSIVKGSHDPVEAETGSDIPEEQDPRFKNRTQMFHKKMREGNISLQLFNVTKEDEGNYICWVPKLESQVTKDNVTLIIVELGNENKVRKKSDEYIVNGSHDPISAKTGSNVILPCQTEPPFNVSAMTVEWKQGSQRVHTTQNGKDVPKEQDQRFNNRTQIFHQEMHRGNISLKLFNVTKEDAGVYTCSVSDRKSEGNVTLIIEPEGLSAGGKAWIVVGVVIVIVIVTAFFIWRKCRAGNRQNGDADQPINQQQPPVQPANEEQVPLNNFNVLDGR